MIHNTAYMDKMRNEIWYILIIPEVKFNVLYNENIRTETVCIWEYMEGN